MLLKETTLAWMNSQAMRYGAALAFYTFFSLTPLLMISIAVAGLVFGQDAAQGHVMRQLEGLVGHANALTVQETLEKARSPSTAGLATVVGVVTLILGSTGVFVELQDSLNRIWDLPAKRAGLVYLITTRIVSFAMVLGLGFLLLVSLLMSAALAAAGTVILDALPAAQVVAHVAHLAISIAMATFVFAMIFKVLPDISLSWRDVWMGGLITALLFTVGKGLIGAYIGRGAVESIYGTAAAVVLILLWTYYSSLILFFGAEFTRVYSEHFGSLSRRSARPQ